VPGTGFPLKAAQRGLSGWPHAHLGAGCRARGTSGCSSFGRHRRRGWWQQGWQRRGSSPSSPSIAWPRRSTCPGSRVEVQLPTELEGAPSPPPCCRGEPRWGGHFLCALRTGGCGTKLGSVCPTEPERGLDALGQWPVGDVEGFQPQSC